MTTEYDFQRENAEPQKSARVDIGPFTKLPNKLFGSGYAARLGPSATVLYVALCEHANRNGSNSFKASDRSLSADTGLSTRTICDARKRLIEHRLITFSRQNGQTYRYTVLKVELAWTPVKTRRRKLMKARALHGGASQSVAEFAEVK
jgi:hypothetical protein